MKYITLSLLYFLLFLGAKAQERADMTLHFDTFEKQSGILFVQLIDDRGETYDSRKIQVRGKHVQTTFRQVPVGRQYGVRVFQDLNSNEELDQNMFGLPTEPYGFSNNARGRFGPPGMGELLFTWTGRERQEIQLD